jgi:hypothetical protein
LELQQFTGGILGIIISKQKQFFSGLSKVENWSFPLGYRHLIHRLDLQLAATPILDGYKKSLKAKT